MRQQDAVMLLEGHQLTLQLAEICRALLYSKSTTVHQPMMKTDKLLALRRLREGRSSL